MTSLVCNASGFTDLRTLRLRYKVDRDSKFHQSGCGRSPENDAVWVGISTPHIEDVSGIEGPGVSNADCESIGRPEGFSLTVTLMITNPTIRGKFYCRGYEGGGVGEVLSQELSVEVKGSFFTFF